MFLLNTCKCVRMYIPMNRMDDLLSELPQSVKTHYGCQIVLRRLEDISRFTKRVSHLRMYDQLHVMHTKAYLHTYIHTYICPYAYVRTYMYCTYVQI